jgi:hypothetical protein
MNEDRIDGDRTAASQDPDVRHLYPLRRSRSCSRLSARSTSVAVLTAAYPNVAAKTAPHFEIIFRSTGALWVAGFLLNRGFSQE